MKVRVALFTFVLFKIGLVAGDAPYPPSGYRPPGPRFELPQNQYGSPTISLTNSLPVLPATNFRSNEAGTSHQNDYNQVYRYVYEMEDSSRQQQNNKNSFVRNNQQYGAPFAPSGQPNAFDQSNQIPSFQQEQAGGVNYNYNSKNLGADGQSGSNQQYGAPGRPTQNAPGLQTSINQQSTRQLDTSVNNQNYDYNRKTYQAPVNPNQEREFSRDVDDDDTVGISNPNYLPPSTTEAFVRKVNKNSSAKEPVDSQEDSRDSSVAVSTAFAKGRYYLLQPNNNLQRLSYPTTQLQRLTNNNEFSAKSFYQNLEQVAPFYNYGAPALIRIY